MYLHYAPNFEKVDGAYCFWSMRALVGAWVGHTFCTYCNFLSAMFVIADTLKEKLWASGSNMCAHVVHALYSSFFFCNTPLLWLCMKAVAKDLGCVLLLDSE